MFTLWGKPQSFCDGLARRDFLKVGMLGAAGLTLPDLLRLRARAKAPGSPKAVIMILLGGGPPHLDMYDLKPDAPAEVRGEFKPIRTNVPGFDICELMPLQAQLADKLALVRNLQMSTSSHNSMENTSGFLWGNQIPGGQGKTARPALGSVVSRLRAKQTMPPFVNLWTADPSSQEDPAYLGPAHRPFFPSGPGLENMGRPKDLSVDQLSDRKALLHTFDQVRRDIDVQGQLVSSDAATARALDIVTSDQVRDAFDIDKEPACIQARYGLEGPRYSFQYLTLSKFLLARRLVEAGVSVVSLQGGSGGWDTHSQNFPTLKRLVPVLDRGIAALVTDLHERGLDQDVCVAVWGEFGRTPKISIYNGTPGRDHYGPANFVLFAGGGLKMGQVIGATDAHGTRPTGVPYRPQHVLATLYQVLGIDPSLTLPDQQGRPMYLLDEREPIAELL